MISLIMYEVKKHFIKLPMLIIFLLFVIFNVIKIQNIYNDKGLFAQQGLSETKKVYWDCFEEFGGKITNEKIEKLMSIYRNIQDKIADRTLSTEYDENSYTYNAYKDEIFFRWFFTEEMEYDYIYKSYSKGIVRNAKENILFYDSIENDYKSKENYKIAMQFLNREIKEFTYTEKYLNYIQYDFSILLVILICIYGLSNMFILEKDTEMNDILKTTKRGGKETVIAKFITSFLFITTISFLFWIVDYFSFSYYFKSFHGNHSPIYALQLFKNTPLNVQLIEYSIISNILKTFGIFIISIIVLFFSSIFKRTLYSYIASLITVYLLILWYDIDLILNIRGMKLANPVSLLINRDLFQNISFINVGNQPIPNYYVSLGIQIIIMLFFSSIIFKCVKRSNR